MILRCQSTKSIFGQVSKKDWSSNIILLLEIVSGHNIHALLEVTINFEYRGTAIINSLPCVSRYNTVIDKVKQYNHITPQHEQWKSLQFVVTEFDETELKSKDFFCSHTSIGTTKKVLASNNQCVSLDHKFRNVKHI